MTDTNELANIFQAGHHIFATKCWYIGASSLVFFDYSILFGNEVKYIWQRKFTLVSYLYLFVRYYSMIAIILDAVLTFDTDIDLETCKRAAFIEPILATIPLLAAANTLLILRIRALYGQSRFIPLLLLLLMLSQIGMGMWIYLQPGRTVIPPPPTTSSIYKECVNLPNPALGDKSAIYLFLETAFDSSVFILTSYKTWREVFSGQSRVRTVLARDGFAYYGVIFAICLTWALMVIFAPTDLQYINAIPTNCFTAIMVCRITLNLREAGNTQSAWVNEPQFSLTTMRFSRLTAWMHGSVSKGPQQHEESGTYVDPMRETSQTSPRPDWTRELNTFEMDHMGTPVYDARASKEYRYPPLKIHMTRWQETVRS